MEINQDIHYMKQAIAEARKAYDLGEVPVGAVVVCNGRIIARCHNLTETLNDVTAHAEMQAITAAASHIGGKYLNDCTLYVSVEPCPMCAGAIINSRIQNVYYGAKDQKAGSVGSLTNLFELQYNHKPTVVSGVLEEECSAILSDFFKKLREKKQNS